MADGLEQIRRRNSDWAKAQDGIGQSDFSQRGLERRFCGSGDHP
jgi:hypothetical protein